MEDDQYRSQGARPKKPSKKVHDRTNEKKSELEAGPSNKGRTVEPKRLTIMTLNLKKVTKGHEHVLEDWPKLLHYLCDEEKKVDVALLQEYTGKTSIIHYNEDDLQDFSVIAVEGVELCILLRKENGIKCRKVKGGILSTTEEKKQKNQKGKILKTINFGAILWCQVEWQGASFFIVNLYLHPESALTGKRLEILRSILEMPGDHNLLIVGGDFNFVNRSEDTDNDRRLRHWYHAFIDGLPAKDVYPRSSKSERTSKGGRRIDKVYVAEELLCGVDSVWTGDFFQDHKPVFFSAFYKREKECHCCKKDKGAFVRCSWCCKWVCHGDNNTCSLEELIDSVRAVPSSSSPPPASQSQPKDGDVDGNKEINNEPPFSFGKQYRQRTRLPIYRCSRCKPTGDEDDANNARGLDESNRHKKKGRIRCLEEENATLKEEIAALKDAEAKLKDAEAKLKDAEAKLKDAEAKLKDAEAKLKDAEAKLKDAEAKLKDDKAKLKDEIENLKNDKAKLKDEIENLKNENSHLKDELALALKSRQKEEFIAPMQAGTSTGMPTAKTEKEDDDDDEEEEEEEEDKGTNH